MSEFTLERAMSYRLATAYDCWGQRRPLRAGRQHGLWFLDAANFDQPPADPEEPADDVHGRRVAALELLQASGRFTPIELGTLDAMVKGLSLDEIARRDGCSRQAVLARLMGNSRGQGGIMKKARYLLPLP